MITFKNPLIGMQRKGKPEQYVGIARIALNNQRRDAPEYRVFRNFQNRMRSIHAASGGKRLEKAHGYCALLF
jgi:hypothetical protein